MFRFYLARSTLQIARLLLLVKLNVTGRQHIPAHGPFIVTLNHMSVADTPLLLIAFPVEPWRFFAGEKWEAHRLIGPLMGRLGAIYINRGEVDRQALREAMKAIEAGSVFGLAPEGTRSKVGQMQSAKGGAAYLASRGRVKVVPVGIAGTENLFANARRLKPTEISVHIGEPYLLPDIGRRARSADMAAYTELIMVKIAALLPPRYHGVYRDSPALKALLANEDPWPYCQKHERA